MLLLRPFYRWRYHFEGNVSDTIWIALFLTFSKSVVIHFFSAVDSNCFDSWQAALDPEVETLISGVVLTSPAVRVQPAHPVIAVCLVFLKQYIIYYLHPWKMKEVECSVIFVLLFLEQYNLAVYLYYITWKKMKQKHGPLWFPKHCVTGSVNFRIY